MNKTALIRNIEGVLYKAKRLWPTPIQIHQISGEPTTDYVSGEITRPEKTTPVRRAVALPRETARKFVYDLAYIASGKNFTEGAYFDMSTRFVLVDRKELPFDFEIHIDDELTIDGERCQVKDYIELPYKLAYVIKCQRTKHGDIRNDSDKS